MDFEAGLNRARRMEKNQQKMGRADSGTPKLKLKGDSNPTKGGGINRAAKS